jgi:hypothetical protein
MFQKLNFNQSRVQADLRELWLAMKRQGQFKEYSDYDDYLARRNQPKERQPNNQRQEDLMIEAQVKARFAGKREPAPALEKIKADVRAYDKEIDVSLIPF